MSDPNSATPPADPLKDLLSGVTHLTPTTPPPPKDAPKGGGPSTLRFVPGTAPMHSPTHSPTH